MKEYAVALSFLYTGEVVVKAKSQDEAEAEAIKQIDSFKITDFGTEQDWDSVEVYMSEELGDVVGE